ncbi:F-box/LRR-repeat protein 13-like [Vicia villosa]|uniref:F-box/LRR-repeat protein 13-like n=1 Tax=Vicia villosa TaxID=3911 RepID=UPI00273B8786|nr:F-box/LRR-repeat protein 13-like [Vicia villosa]
MSDRLRMKMHSLDDLPNEILLHILSYLKIKDVVKTSVLSKRWRNLWKHLRHLKLDTYEFSKPSFFSECVSEVVASRGMGDYPLRSLEFKRHGAFRYEIFTGLINHAMSNGLQQLNIGVPSNIGLPYSIFSCHSLTSIYISVSRYDIKKRTRLPKLLDLPGLRSLRLEFVGIQADDSGRAEPFSTCTKLTDLNIDECFLVYPRAVSKDSEGVLNINNATLSNLTIKDILTLKTMKQEPAYKYVIHTPKLVSFTVNGSPFRASSVPKRVKVELQSSSMM